MNCSIPDGKKQRVFTVLPFFHIYGFNGIMNIVLRDGGHLITLPRFTPEDYLKVLVSYRPTFLFVVPSLLLFLASHPAVTEDHFASIEGIQSGAAPLTEGLLQKFREKIKRTDIIVRQGLFILVISFRYMFVPFGLIAMLEIKPSITKEVLVTRENIKVVKF